eukprot:TRINITY_DN17924_c0_g1_i1.p1 TRINITY_DN17924_c0_g1~~TRINITY_DN17924_c0_g1_i1.p1  ORF type:complete len:189 (-),score=62.65 TRINITY_DN17924_c0_g1_i1:142-708(-)
MCIRDRGNHSLFMFFLLYHAVFMSYVSAVGTAIISAQVLDLRVHEAWYYDKGGQQQPVSYFMIVQWAVRNYSQLFAVTAFCALLQCLFYGFFCYQLGLLLRNVTTNETFKLKDLKHCAAVHNAALVMPTVSPYFVSWRQSLAEVFCAPISGARTKTDPARVWDGEPASKQEPKQEPVQGGARRRKKKK